MRRPAERSIAKQRFERGADGKRTFWEVSSNDRTVEERWGDVGGKARKRTSTFPSMADAQSEVEELVAAKRAEGFEPLAAPSEPRKAIVATKRLVDVELERMLAEAPTDVAVWKTYADWLIEHGEAWGEVIALATSGSNTKLHLDKAEKAWRAGMPGCHFDWRTLGVVVTAELQPKRCRKAPIADVVARMLAHPAGRVIRFLTIELPPDDPVGTFQPIIDAIAEAGPLPLLDMLVLRRRGHTRRRSKRIADFSPLWAAAPRLGRLDVFWDADQPGGTPCTIGAISEAKHLKTLAFAACGLPASVAIDLGRATLARVRHFELSVGPREHGATVSLESLAGILAGTGLPNVETLVLNALDWDVGLIEALAAAPVVERLKQLWLTDGVLATAASEALIAHAARFRHLEELFVDMNDLSASELAAIAAHIPSVKSYHQREPGAPFVDHDEDKDDEDDEDS